MPASYGAVSIEAALTVASERRRLAPVQLPAPRNRNGDMAIGARLRP
jgi:hypothetical protein